MIFFIWFKLFVVIFLFFNLVKGKLIIVFFGVESFWEFKYILYRIINKIFFFEYS